VSEQQVVDCWRTEVEIGWGQSVIKRCQRDFPQLLAIVAARYLIWRWQSLFHTFSLSCIADSPRLRNVQCLAEFVLSKESEYPQRKCFDGKEVPFHGHFRGVLCLVLPDQFIQFWQRNEVPKNQYQNQPCTAFKTRSISHHPTGVRCTAYVLTCRHTILVTYYIYIIYYIILYSYINIYYIYIDICLNMESACSLRALAHPLEDLRSFPHQGRRSARPNCLLLSAPKQAAANLLSRSARHDCSWEGRSCICIVNQNKKSLWRKLEREALDLQTTCTGTYLTNCIL
jgi:hypothetical protein